MSEDKLTAKQKYDRDRYLKNRSKILALAAWRNYRTPIEKTCAICAKEFQCGGPNALRSPKAITCSTECQKSRKHEVFQKYLKQNYSAIRAKDNEGHRVKRQDEHYKAQELQKNRIRMANYRKDPSWREKENAKGRVYFASYRKTDRWRKWRDSYRPKAVAITRKWRVKKLETKNLLMLAALPSVIKQTINKLNT